MSVGKARRSLLVWVLLALPVFGAPKKEPSPTPTEEVERRRASLKTALAGTRRRR